MLWSLDAFRGYGVQATDGDLGTVHDVLFDDAAWTIRYLVVDTGILFGRRVLIAAASLGRPEPGARKLPVQLTRDRIRHSPSIDLDRPVARRQEADLHAYYGWVPYWSAAPAVLPPTGETGERDPHLRSEREVRGYDIHASDGHIGHVSDMLADEDGWAIRYLVVDTRNWWPGRHVLVSPRWVREISWSAREVRVGMSREQIESSPDYEAGSAVDRAYERRLHRHYGQTIYWE